MSTSIRFAHSEINLICKSLQKQSEYLHGISNSGTAKINNELEEIRRVEKHINRQIEKFMNDDPQHWTWDSQRYEFDSNALPLMKGCLLEYIRSLSSEADKRLAKNMPPEALQDIEEEINECNRLLHSHPIFAPVTELSIIGKGRPYNEPNAVETRESLTINATINNESGIVALGRDIHINQNYIQLENELKSFATAVENDQSIKDDVKSEIHSYIRTIESQLTLKKPNPTILRTAWKAIEGLAAVEGLTQFLIRISPYILPLLVQTAQST